MLCLPASHIRPGWTTGHDLTCGCDDCETNRRRDAAEELAEVAYHKRRFNESSLLLGMTVSDRVRW